MYHPSCSLQSGVSTIIVPPVEPTADTFDGTIKKICITRAPLRGRLKMSAVLAQERFQLNVNGAEKEEAHDLVHLAI